MKPGSAFVSAIFGLSVFCAACGGDDAAGEEPTAGDPDGVCATAETRPEFVAGMAQEGTGIVAKLVEADPAPPRMGDNRWTLELVGEHGHPLSGLDVEVSPWMVKHGHGSQRVAVEDEGEGRYSAYPVNFNMPGLWETTVAVRVGEVDEEVVFAFCVE